MGSRTGEREGVCAQTRTAPWKRPDVGDWEKDQAFSTAAWVKVPDGNASGAILARMDDKHDFRGWDMWLQNARVATHIINKWPADALKVASKAMLSPKVWHHVCVTYTGGANPEAVHIYIDGKAQDTDVEANTLKSTIRTTVPFKIGQRHSTSGVDGTAIQDVRLYARVLPADDVTRLMRGTRVGYLIAKGADKLAAPEKDELFSGWLTAIGRRLPRPVRQSDALWKANSRRFGRGAPKRM